MKSYVGDPRIQLLVLSTLATRWSARDRTCGVQAFISPYRISPNRHPWSSVIFESQEDDDSLNLRPVPVTPCTRICRYNANIFNAQVCIGCFRETFEIGNWASMGPMEKYYALLDAMDRLDEAAETSEIDEMGGGISREELERQSEYWKAQASAKES